MLIGDDIDLGLLDGELIRAPSPTTDNLHRAIRETKRPRRAMYGYQANNERSPPCAKYGV